jgi:carbon-monoxide dehydrogenase large subunit
MGKMIGESIKRVEDHRFITGTGEYTDDIVLPRMTHAYILRSHLAHAKITSVDTSAAKVAEGVVAIYTGQDVAHINGIPTGWQVNFTDGEVMREPKHPLLVKDKVLHVGDGVAIVIAESKEQARDAADLRWITKNCQLWWMHPRHSKSGLQWCTMHCQTTAPLIGN